MSPALFASRLSKDFRCSPPTDGPGLRSPDAVIEQFFQLLESGIIDLVGGQRPFEYVVFDRLSSKRGHGLQFFMFVVGEVN